MTELKAAKVAALAQRLESAAFNLRKEMEEPAAWVELPYRFPEAPTFDNVTKALADAIGWHIECEVRCAYGTFPMIFDTCFWVSMTALTSVQIHEVCVLLNRLYHEALGKWG